MNREVELSKNKKNGDTLRFRTSIYADGLHRSEVVKRGDVFNAVKDSLSSIPLFTATSRGPFGLLPQYVDFMHYVYFVLFIF